MELVMISCDEATLLKILGVTEVEYRVSYVKVGREVWGIYAVA